MIKRNVGRQMLFCVYAALLTPVSAGEAPIARDALTLEFEAAPIEVELSPNQSRLLNAPSPVALAHADTDDHLKFSWSTGQMISSEGSTPFTLEIDILPTASIDVDGTIVALLESVDGRLTLVKDSGPERWAIEPANYGVHLPKINHMPDGRVVPLLPIKLVRSGDGEAAFGHLAVFCRLDGPDRLVCSQMRFVFSDSAAEDRPVAGTVEEILTRSAATEL